MYEIETYLMTFIAGIQTFISPCFLPMIPIYITYLSVENESGKTNTVVNALFFILGFSSIFILLGATASTLGKFLLINTSSINVIGGIIIILMGLNFMGVLNISILNKTFKPNIGQDSKHIEKSNKLSSFMLGVIFSVGWTPCVGIFLSSALIKASTTGSVINGIILLSLYSLGLGIPFFICGVFIDQLKGLFDFIKRNYGIINIISGGFLVTVGILMISGQFEKILQFLQKFSV